MSCAVYRWYGPSFHIIQSARAVCWSEKLSRRGCAVFEKFCRWHERMALWCWQFDIFFSNDVACVRAFSRDDVDYAGTRGKLQDKFLSSSKVGNFFFSSLLWSIRVCSEGNFAHLVGEFVCEILWRIKPFEIKANNNIEYNNRVVIIIISTP